MTRIGPILVVSDQQALQRLGKLFSGYQLVRHAFWIKAGRSYDEYVVDHNGVRYDVWFELRFGLRATRTR